MHKENQDISQLESMFFIHNVNLLCDFQAMCLLAAYMLSQFQSVWVHGLSRSFIIETVTRGRGERSCATCRSATRGTVRRLGSTRWEAIASIIIVSDMALQMNARTMLGGTHKGRDTHTNRQRVYTIADHMHK